MSLSLQSAPVRIICIGDSITQGRGDHSASGQIWQSTDGWRYDFWKLLIDAGIEAEFVGTNAEGFESTPVYPDYKGQTFNNRNEAHWGWTTEQILEKLKTTNTQWTSDIALIYLGTNREPATDDEKVNDPDGVIRTTLAMKGIVALLQKNNPSMTIAIRCFATNSPRGKGLTESFQKIATERSTPSSKILAVLPSPDWQWDPESPNADTIDGCHPNKQGDLKLATDFFKALYPTK